MIRFQSPWNKIKEKRNSFKRSIKLFLIQKLVKRQIQWPWYHNQTNVSCQCCHPPRQIRERPLRVKGFYWKVVEKYLVPVDKKNCFIRHFHETEVQPSRMTKKPWSCGVLVKKACRKRLPVLPSIKTIWRYKMTVQLWCQRYPVGVMASSEFWEKPILHLVLKRLFECLVTIQAVPRSNIRTNCSVLSKMGTFQMSFWLYKSTATLLPTKYVLVINETFQMRCCIMFCLKGYQNYNKSKSKVPRKYVTFY